jgi:uncharacterized protein YkwD
MLDRRLLAVTVVAILTIGGFGLVWFGMPQEDQVSDRPIVVPPFEAPPESVALMDTDVLNQQAVESNLIDQALISTTTTLFVETTTTTPPAPTTTVRTAGTTSPPATSPPTTSPPSAAPTHDSGAESQFASSINSYRSSNGLPALTRSGSLDSYARAWAQQLVENRSLSHSNIGSLLGEWSAVAENVGYGGSVGGVFDALVGSSGHRANMLGDYTHIGIGVYRDSDGTLWTAHVFAR